MIQRKSQRENKMTHASATELWEMVRKRLPHSVFPDNLIHVVDETLASTVFDGKRAVGMAQFQQVLNRLAENAPK